MTATNPETPAPLETPPGGAPFLCHERADAGTIAERTELFDDGRVVRHGAGGPQVLQVLDARALRAVRAAIESARLHEIAGAPPNPPGPHERWTVRAGPGIHPADLTVRADRRIFAVQALSGAVSRVLSAQQLRSEAASAWWMPHVSRLRLLLRRALFVAPLGRDALPTALSGRGASARDQERLARMTRAIDADTSLRPRPASDPFEQIAEALALTEAERDALLAVALPELRPELAAAWATIHGEAIFGGVDERLLRLVLDPLGDRTRDVAAALRPDGVLLGLGALRPRRDPAGARRLEASRRVRDRLAGLPWPPAEELARTPIHEPPLIAPRLFDVPLFPLSPELRAEVRAGLRAGVVLVLRGPLRAGYTLLARQIAGERGRGLLELPLSRFSLPAELPAVREALLQAALMGAMVLVRDLHVLAPSELGTADPGATDTARRDPIQEERTLVAVVEALRQARGQLLVVAEDPTPARVLLEVVERLPVRLLPVAAPDAVHRQALWAVRAEQAGRDGGPEAPGEGHLAALDADEIERTVDLAIALGDAPGRSEEATRRVATQRLRQLGLPVHSTATWERVVLPDHTQQVLTEIRRFGRYRTKVMGEWQFRDQSGYGTGLSVLFSGPSGTGKTLVAGLLARDLGQALFQVDLSRLVSKYIGETEQRLSELFSAADSAGAALLFDEADSLFAQRTEVKSSVDRYANLEVNYLLQRMESFEGVVILTTNFRQSIDQAFMRRIRFKVDFATPDREQRRRLWEVLLPPGAPLEPDIRFDKVGDAYELTGGEIRNAILRAALVAAESGGPITQELLIEAAVRECQETGKVTRIEPITRSPGASR